MKCQNLFSRQDKKNITNLSSENFAHIISLKKIITGIVKPDSLKFWKSYIIPDPLGCLDMQTNLGS